ncbi:peptidylprolyl isomerase [Yoonia sp.]|uniref:peptidylprolyl isomerase n=1 Tax=Yoonia sp. TaxID=2212373 RepID=UPI001A0B1F88|nr:peptidylprolyl isomerase [Yoonia sp.]MBE0412866.1 peptidylprolyl isomerase [Yoonia sp.]
MRAFTITAFVLALLLGVGANRPALAQGQFDAAITVNDRVITRYELAQRIRLLEVFRTPGDLNRIARDALIEDRLKEQELDRVGLRLSDAALAAAVDDFASRADMTADQFARMLAQNGVDRVTLEDFVRVGVSWRDYVRSRFNRQVTVTDADIDRALARQGTGAAGIEVLLSEIIIAAPPERAAEAQRVAGQIAQMRSFAAFEDAARQVSALPSRDNGGRLGWLPIDNYPPQLQNLLLGLRPGEVTQPIDIPNGIALFQMRAVREGARRTQTPASIAYATYAIPGGQTPAARAAAQDIVDRLDTCDDLYGVARNQPPEMLQRADLPPQDIPGDIALELAQLDPGEISLNLTRDNGQTLVLLMLCGRTAVGQQGLDREAVRNQIRSQRLAGLANALVADLQAAATITQR